MAKAKVEKESTDLQVRAQSELSVAAAHLANETEVVGSDVIVPSLLIGQGLSPAVTARKVSLGDIYRSDTRKKIGDPDHPVEIIPLKMTNTWSNYEKVAGKTQPQYRGQEHRGAIKNAAGETVSSNEGLPWEFTGENGQTMFRRKTITLYALLPSDVDAHHAEIAAAIESGEAPDLSKGVMPVVITFQSTSFKHAGKKCATFFTGVKSTALAMAGRMFIAPFIYSIPLMAKDEQGQDNAMWFVYDLGTPKALITKDMSKEEKAKRQALIDTASGWVATLNRGQVQIDGGDEVMEPGQSRGRSGSMSMSEMEV